MSLGPAPPPLVTVVGLGPAGADLGSVRVAALLAASPVERTFLRTARHPAAIAMVARGVATFDHVYEAAESIEDVYLAIVAALVQSAPCTYAVPGSPLVAERTVDLLRIVAAEGHISLVVEPAISFLDLAWARLGVDPLAAGVRLVDGHRFAVEAAGERGPLLVAQCDSAYVLSAIKLAVEQAPLTPVTVMQRLGLSDEAMFDVAWADLDRASAFIPDHLTSVWIPELASPVGAELARFDELTRTLRQRCPWDQEQTHASLIRYLVEETYEVVEAIENLALSDAGPDHLEEELGDLLYQVFFHATLAAEQGWFTIADVARGVHDKLVRRHPHVFGTVEADDIGTVVRNWEAIKAQEKIDAGTPRTSLVDGIPPGLPALLRALKVGKKAAASGFDWPAVTGAAAKVGEELGELLAEPSEDELGDLLFAVVNVARHLKLDPETALRGATSKFADRFGALQALAAGRGIEMEGADLATLDALWDEVKAR